MTSTHTHPTTHTDAIAPAPAAAVTLRLTGMTCGACAARIERCLNRIEGVSARVNYASERANALFPPDIAPGRLVEAVEALGYGAELVTEGPLSGSGDRDEQRVRSLGRRLLVAVLLLMPLCDASLGFWILPQLRFPGWQWVSLALASPVVGWAAWPFYRAALRAARHHTTTMDTLVSIGILSSTAWSVYAMFWQDTGRSTRSLMWILGHGSSGGIYLEVGAGVTTFLLAGRYFEARARRHAGDALRSLAELGAKDVTILRPNGSERRLPISALEVGDRFVVRPGEAVATDGEVEDGECALDCSAMTGESVPVDVGPGDPVTGGTLALSGRLVVRATKVGAETQLAQMAELVERAQNEKAAAQRLADRISAFFVPGILILAAVTLVAWLLTGHDAGRAVSVALSVLIIACPCALGLATPAALVVASAEGANHGIFFKGYGALERSRHIDTVVFDKTGTLTEGRMVVTDVWTAPGVSEETLLGLAGAVEARSAHPIAVAVVAAAAERGVPLPAADRFSSLTGHGVRGTVDGHRVVVCRPGTADGGWTDDGALSACAQLEQLGRTTVVVGCDGAAVGVIGLADTVRASSAAAVAELQALGLHCVLVSGDNPVVAKSVGVALGISDVIGGALPADKVRTIERLRAAGRTVAVVGDGVNDGPALAAADLGIAVGSGTDVAIEAADLLILRDDLRVVAHAVNLARRTLRRIRGNLVWAFGYNVIAIPLAAAGLLDPLIAGAAMALSSGFVVYNSAGIRRRHPDDLERLLRDHEDPLVPGDTPAAPALPAAALAGGGQAESSSPARAPTGAAG